MEICLFIILNGIIIGTGLLIYSTNATNMFVNLLTAIISFYRAFGTSIYTPTVPNVVRDFGVSETVAILPLATYVLSLSFTSMLSAPISETLGRMCTYRVAVPISALFSLGCGFSPNFAALCILRFFTGCFGSTCLAVSAGTTADLFHSQHYTIIGSFLNYFPFLSKDQDKYISLRKTNHIQALQ